MASSNSKNNPIVITNVDDLPRTIQIVTLIGSNGEMIDFTDGAIDINLTNNGIIDVNNSTSSPLLAGAIYTGTSVEVKDYGIIYITTKSDVSSAIDGLSIQQSSDGINWDHTDEYTINAGSGKTFSFQAGAQYFRVVYTNGGLDQTYFRLQTLFKKGNGKPSSHRIQDAINDDDDAELTKAVLTAKRDGDGFDNINSTASGNLKVTDAESGLAIAKGDVQGTTFIHKFGEASNIDTADGFADIWDGSANILTGKISQYTFSTIADIDSISSSDNGDVQLIEIQGLDTNYLEVTQTVALTGQATALLVTPLVRVFRMINIGNVNILGQIFLYINGAAITGGVPNLTTDVRAIINNDNNQTLMAIYTIPANKTGYMRDWYASLSKDKVTSCVIHLDARPFNQVFQLKHISAITSTGTSYIQHRYEEPEIFLEKTDIIMHANTTTNDSGVSAGFDIVLIDN